MPLVRTRLAIGLISLAAIAAELAMMRSLSLRFWHYFGYLVISVALLGFGAGGTAVTLGRRRILAHLRPWLCALAFAFALALPLCSFLATRVDLNVQFLAWDLGQIGRVALVELLMFVPFFLAGTFVAAVLLEGPGRINGHYAANLVGSGLGAIAAVAGMYVLSNERLAAAAAAAAWLAGAVLLPRRKTAALWACAIAAGVLVLSSPAFQRPAISQYKMLSLVKAMPGTETIHRDHGPLGRIDVVAGEVLHYAPGLSLQYTDDVPPHAVLMTDGDLAGVIYDCKKRRDWLFMDYTTAAAAYHLRPRARPAPAVLIADAAGGADIGLASFHRSRAIVALQMNRQIIDAMTGPLAGRGGSIYRGPGVTVVNAEPRGYLAGAGAPGEGFDIIQVHLAGASAAGLNATQESYLYTVEAFGAMLRHLSDGGVLCATCQPRHPPRDALRLLDTAAQALRRMGMEPAQHLAMIRSLATVTVMASNRRLTAKETDRLRRFCDERGFDLCYLPGIAAAQANRYHVLDEPYYFQAARSLLGRRRQEFLDNYLFDVPARTDDRPYFFHFFRWRSLPTLFDQLGRSGRAFLEIDYLMLAAAVAQSVLMAAVMIVLPLAPGVRSLTNAPRKAATLGYFLLLGAGFMLLEMGLLQKLILYLSHPIYSAAVAIASFLIFAGLGSQLSRYWPMSGRRLAGVAAGAVVAIALLYLLGMDGWLRLTQSRPIAIRALIAAATIAPLAFAMGHMLPAGLRRVSVAAPNVVSWAWAANGFASVAATVAAPLLAMNVGFRLLVVAAVGCYAAAGLLFTFLPGGPGRRPLASLASTAA